MENNFKFIDLIGLVSFITFLIPDKYLFLYEKWIIFLIAVILFLLYKLIYILIKYNKLYRENININKNRNELAKQFTEKSKTIDKLSFVNKNQEDLMCILLKQLQILMATKNADKNYIDSLIRLLLDYKSYMEEIKNGTRNL